MLQFFLQVSELAMHALYHRTLTSDSPDIIQEENSDLPLPCLSVTTYFSLPQNKIVSPHNTHISYSSSATSFFHFFYAGIGRHRCAEDTSFLISQKN